MAEVSTFKIHVFFLHISEGNIFITILFLGCVHFTFYLLQTPASLVSTLFPGLWLSSLTSKVQRWHRDLCLPNAVRFSSHHLNHCPPLSWLWTFLKYWNAKYRKFLLYSCLLWCQETSWLQLHWKKWWHT